MTDKSLTEATSGRYMVLVTSSSFSPLRNKFRWSTSLTWVIKSDRCALNASGSWSCKMLRSIR